jgi:hypothetical protein
MPNKVREIARYRQRRLKNWLVGIMSAPTGTCYFAVMALTTAERLRTTIAASRTWLEKNKAFFEAAAFFAACVWFTLDIIVGAWKPSGELSIETIYREIKPSDLDACKQMPASCQDSVIAKITFKNARNYMNFTRSDGCARGASLSITDVDAAPVDRASGARLRCNEAVADRQPVSCTSLKILEGELAAGDTQTVQCLFKVPHSECKRLDLLVEGQRDIPLVGRFWRTSFWAATAVTCPAKQDVK